MPNHETPTPPQPEEGDMPKTHEERLQEFQATHPEYHFGDSPAPAGTKFHIRGLESVSGLAIGDGISQVNDFRKDGSGRTTTQYQDGTVETTQWTGTETQPENHKDTTDTPKKGKRMAGLLAKLRRDTTETRGEHGRSKGMKLDGIIIGSGKAYDNGVDVSDQRVVERRNDGLYLNGKRIQKF